MNTDALFQELEPPPGGAERFSRRLDEIGAERPSPRMRMRMLTVAVAGAAAAAALAIAILLPRPANDVPPMRAGPPAIDVLNAPELDRLLGRSARPAELVVVVNRETAAVTEIDSTNERVRIYEID